MVQTQETSSSCQLPSKKLNLAQNYNDPYFLCHGDNPNSKLGEIILDGSNYVNWSRSIQLALDAKNKLGFIDGSLSRPPNVDSAEFHKWMLNDCMVSGWILNSIDKSTAESFIFTQSARQLWIEIKERYGHSDAPQLYEIHKNLMNIQHQHDDDSIADYYGKLKKIWDQLSILEPFPTCTCGIMVKCTCGLIKKMVEADELKKLIQFIAGLNKNYDEVVNKANLLTMNPLPSVDEAYHTLHQIEKQRALSVESSKAMEMRSAARRISYGSSNFSINTGSSKEIKYDRYCEHCKMNGHLKHQCFKIIGYPDRFKHKNPQMSSSQAILGQISPHSIDQQVTSHLYKEYVKMMQSSASPSSGINFADIDHATPEDWRKALSKVVPAVVVVRTTACRAFDTEAAGASYATGFVVDKRNGIILTNRHVVKPGPVVAEAKFVNGEEVPVYPIYRDPVHDFGFFRYDPDAIQFLRYEDIPLAPEAACVGLEIRIVGNDSGDKVSILAGTIARLDREAPHYKKDGYNDFNTFYIQAASGTKGGSSGSPVIDWQGRAVALSSGSKSSSACAFFLPLQRVVRALELLRNGRETFRDRWEVVPIPRGTLQMTLVHIEFDETRRLGLQSETEQLVRCASPLETGMLVVDSVVPGGPAHIHLEPGDILVRFNGEVITQFLKMETLLDDSVHHKVQLEIERGGKPLTVVLPVEDLHSITPNYFLEVSGAIIHPLSYQQARNFQFHCGIVYVSEPGYMLYRAGVPRHAIIKKFAGEEILHLENLITVLSKLSRGARVPLEYISYTDRHRTRSVLVTVDGHHQWYAPPLIYTRDDSSGLWIAKPAFPPEASPLSSVINQVESCIVTADTSLYGHDDLQLVEPGASEDAVQIENQGVVPGAANASVVERVIEPALVMLDVHVPSSCMLDGVHCQHFFGTGVIIYHSVTMGLVVVDRNTVAISASEVMLSFSAFPIEIRGEVVFLHPIHNYALVSYDPAALGSIGASLVRAAELLPEPAMRRGDSVYLVGLNRSLHVRSKKYVVTNACASLNIASANCPRYRQTNMEVIELDEDFGNTFSGALTDERGRIQAIWGTFSTQKKYGSSLVENQQIAKGIPIYTISSILKNIISGAKGPSLLINGIKRPMPLVRILEVELYPTLLSKARSFGLSDNWIRALVKKDPVRGRVLCVKGCYAGSSADNLLEQGDMILAINKELVTCFRDIEDACQLLDQYGDNDGKLNLTILRQGSEIELLVGTDVRDGTGTTRVINWCGCIVHEPHSAVRALGFLPKEGHGVYITRCCLGSPVDRYGLSPLQWIVEVNGKPTPDLDSFVDVTKDLEHGVFVCVKTIRLNGKSRVLTLKQDLHYWPTWELRFDRETAQWHRKTIKALNCNTA